MYKVEKKNYGFKLTFSDIVDESEMLRWIRDSEKILKENTKNFGVLIYMRTLQTLSIDSMMQMHIGQKLFKDSGMQRSAVIVSSSKTALQFISIAKKTGIYEWERYISTVLHPEWEKIGLDWIKNAIDPEKQFFL